MAPIVVVFFLSLVVFCYWLTISWVNLQIAACWLWASIGNCCFSILLTRVITYKKGNSSKFFLTDGLSRDSSVIIKPSQIPFSQWKERRGCQTEIASRAFRSVKQRLNLALVDWWTKKLLIYASHCYAYS